MVRPWSVGTLVASWMFIGSCSSDPRPEHALPGNAASELPPPPPTLAPEPSPAPDDVPEPPEAAPAVAEAAPAVAEPAPALVEPAPAVAEAAPAVAEPAPALAEPAPDEGTAAEGPAPTAVPELIAEHREVFVYAEPSRKRKLGYLRAGARVARGEKPVSTEGCPGGVFRVAPEGFVCADAAVRLDAADAVSSLLARRPDRLAPLPFVYARASSDTPPLYTKLPSEADQRGAEGNLRARPRTFAELAASPVPVWLEAERQTPTLWGQRRAPLQIVVGQVLPGSSFALLDVFEHQSRQFGLRSDLTLVPLDRVTPVSASNFHGLSLEEATLPVAFVLRRGANLYESTRAGALSPVRPLGFREALPLSGNEQRLHGARYLETTGGQWIRDERLVRVERPTTFPKWARSGRRWIHVSIGAQTLVAYEGERPVYVTLVSTGVDGLGDPATTRSTVLGQFLVHTKHVTAPMTSDEEGDEYELLDVPWVQYFSENYAFHAAYWHDEFGSPKSHGCVNLSPRDARFLFHWTDPAVPPAWHGAFSLLSGTPVEITP